MNPGSIACPNCGALGDEPCEPWCAPQTVDERAKHLAGGVVDGPASGVERPLVNDLD